jgi:hypothetical protein
VLEPCPMLLDGSLQPIAGKKCDERDDETSKIPARESSQRNQRQCADELRSERKAMSRVQLP